MHFELLKEVLEQEVFEDTCTNLVRQFGHQGHILRAVDRTVLVITPKVFEVLLKVGNHFGW